MELKVDISNEHLTELFIMALEGGSNYWYYIDTTDISVVNKVFSPDDRQMMSTSEKVVKAILEGKVPHIPIYDQEELDEVLLGHFSLDSIRNGVRKMSEENLGLLANAMMDQFDGYDADSFFQYCVMGEQRFS